MSQATISIRVDQGVKKNFDALCEDFGISTTAAFIIFMKTVIRERRIPFEIRSETDLQKRQKAGIFMLLCSAVSLILKLIQWLLTGLLFLI